MYKRQVTDNQGYAIRIDKGDYLLDCYVGGVFARRYPISHGAKETPTPLGVTKLTNRVWHPSWTLPTTHEVVQYGDPQNILGPVWMPFASEGIGQTGIGIHGFTGANGKMGAMLSNGCIRMQNDQAEELYYTLAHPDQVPTSVQIVD